MHELIFRILCVLCSFSFLFHRESAPQINMVDPFKMTRITHDAVVKKWGVSADNLGDLLALAGDSSDNVPGVRGIGPKIAATLINEFGSMEKCLQNADQVKQKGRREKLIEQADMVSLFVAHLAIKMKVQYIFVNILVLSVWF